MIEVLWFYLPAMAANFVLYFLWASFGRCIVMPVDFGYSLGPQRMIGDSRGLSGVSTVILVGLLVGLAQGRAEEGVVLALGVDLGTMVNSFCKRRTGLEPGQAWIFDHVDYILGASMTYAIVYTLPGSFILSGLLLGGLVHWGIGRLLRPLLDPPGAE